MAVEYLCISCKRRVPYDVIHKKVKCPYCGGKILVKIRPNSVKIVKAR